MRRSDFVARMLGVVVFVGGVALLAFSFATAYNWFTDPSAGLQTVPASTASGTEAPATTQLGASALRLVIRLALLLIMTIIGSLLAGRGAQIYFAASNARQPAIYPRDDL